MLRLCSGGRKINFLVPIYLLCLTELRMLQASGGGGIPQTSSLPVGSFLRATPAGVLAPPRGTLPPHQGRSNTEDRRNTTGPLILFAAQWSVRPIAPACHDTFSAQCSTKNAPTHWTRYPRGRFSPGFPPPYHHINSGSPEHAGLREQVYLRLGFTVEAIYSQSPLFSNLPGAVSTLVRAARPTQCVPYSPMPMVTRVSQMEAYQVCSHPASVCLVDHVLHGN